MDQTELQKNIALYYSKLPPNAQAAFSSMAWLETLKQIAQKYSLTEDQIETLGTETTLVLLGIIHINEYEENIRAGLNLPKEIMSKISAEINVSVLNALRPELTDTFNANTTSDVAIEERLSDRFDSLPEDIKSIIGKANYQDTLYNIAQEHRLSIEQMGKLEECTVNVLLDAARPEKFEGDVKSDLHITDDMARLVTNEINEKIFKKIRKNIISMYKPEPKKEIHPILEQKFATTFQAETKTTEYTLNNLSKTKELPAGTPMLEIADRVPRKKEMSDMLIPKKPASPKPSATPTPAPEAPDKSSSPAAYVKNRDPYRLSPEEQ